MVSWATPLEARPRGFTGCHRRPRHFLRNNFQVETNVEHWAREPDCTKQLELETDFEGFFAQAPEVHPNSSLIKGPVCGIRVEEVEDPLMQRIRYLDKLVDELAKGKSMEKILRR